MSAPFNPYAHLHAASVGDIEALRLLATKGCNLAVAENDICAMAQGLVFARLGYARTGAVEDAGLLMSLLAVAGQLADDQKDKDDLQAEAIALASLLADAGEPNCEQWLSTLVGESTAEAAAGAQTIREMMLERVG